jgi:hypothetical protein
MEHFVIHGFLDAVQHCIMTAMLYSLMEKLCQIFNQMTLRWDTLLPPCPPYRPMTAHPVEGTIRIAPEHLRQRDQLAQASSSMGCAPVPHFTSMGGALMALQQFVSNMTVDSSQIDSTANRTMAIPPSSMTPSNMTPIIEPIEESVVPPEGPEAPSVSPLEPILSFATVMPPPVIVEPVGPVALPAPRVEITGTAMPTTSLHALVTDSAGSSVFSMDYFALTGISEVPPKDLPPPPGLPPPELPSSPVSDATMALSHPQRSSQQHLM